MDPITRASKVFLKEAAAHWKARRGPVLFLVTEASSRGDLVKTLRLAEQSPTCRRPLFLFEGAFDGPESYFAALEKSLVQDYEALKKGAAEEGVSLSDRETSPRVGDRHASDGAACGSRIRAIGRALEGKLEGIDVALVPRQVTSPTAFRDAVTSLAGELRKGGARLLVLALVGGPLSEEAEGRAAHFHVDPDELADYLRNLGNSPSEGPAAPAPTPPPAVNGAEGKGKEPGAKVPEGGVSREVRGLLLSAAQATRRGHHDDARRLFEQARERCAEEKWAVEEAVVLVALAGACLSAGAPDSAVESYAAAFAQATRTEAHSLAAQAALGQGAVRMQQKRYLQAMGAYAAAADAAELARAPMLHVEARRMEGTAALAAGKQPEALRAWKSAAVTGSEMDAPARQASNWEDVVVALTALLRKNGMTAQADHVEAQAASLNTVSPTVLLNATRSAVDAVPSGPDRAPSVAAHPGSTPPSPSGPSPREADGEDATAPSNAGIGVTGPVDLSRLNLPALPFDRRKKP